MLLNTSVQLSNFNQQIRLIVGLGNIGTKYENTRHNAGFLFVDYLIHVFLKELDFHADIEEKDGYKLYNFRFMDLKILKPQLMMNLSGEAIYKYLKYQNYALEEILVVHDDLDLGIGKYKLQHKKSPRQHNGIISIENHLAGNSFYRLRLGIENRESRVISGVDYVLMKFSSEERSILDNTFKEICLKEFSFSRPETDYP